MLAATGPMPEASMRRPAAEICAALGHVHSLDFIHLDVKPENIVITTLGQHKLADFGSCLRLQRAAEGDGPRPAPPAYLGEIIGTPEMMAPEVFYQQPVCQTADWWSYGCLLFEMLTGHSPFFDARDSDAPDPTLALVERILRAEFAFPDAFVFPDTSDTVVALIRSLLTREPSLRLGARPLGQAAISGHAWFAAEPPNQSTVPAATPPTALQETEDGNGQVLAQVQALPNHPHVFVNAEMPTGGELMAALLALSQPVTVE